MNEYFVLFKHGNYLVEVGTLSARKRLAKKFHTMESAKDQICSHYPELKDFRIKLIQRKKRGKI